MTKIKKIALISTFLLLFTFYSIFTNLIRDNEIVHNLVIKRFDLSYYFLSQYAGKSTDMQSLMMYTNDDAYSDLILICILNNYFKTAEKLINDYPYISQSKKKVVRFYSICSFYYYRIRAYQKAIEYCKKILIAEPGNKTATKNLYFLLKQKNSSETSNSDSLIEEQTLLYEMLIINRNTSENEGVQNFIEEKLKNSNEKIENYYW